MPPILSPSESPHCVPCLFCDQITFAVASISPTNRPGPSDFEVVTNHAPPAASAIVWPHQSTPVPTLDLPSASVTHYIPSSFRTRFVPLTDAQLPMFASEPVS